MGSGCFNGTRMIRGYLSEPPHSSTMTAVLHEKPEPLAKQQKQNDRDTRCNEFSSHANQPFKNQIEFITKANSRSINGLQSHWHENIVKIVPLFHLEDRRFNLRGEL